MQLVKLQVNTLCRIRNTDVFGVPVILCISLALFTALVDCLLRVFICEGTAAVRVSDKRDEPLRGRSRELPFQFLRNIERGRIRGVREELYDIFHSSFLCVF